MSYWTHVIMDCESLLYMLHSLYDCDMRDVCTLGMLRGIHW